MDDFSLGDARTWVRFVEINVRFRVYPDSKQEKPTIYKENRALTSVVREHRVKSSRMDIPGDEEVRTTGMCERSWIESSYREVRDEI